MRWYAAIPALAFSAFAADDTATLLVRVKDSLSGQPVRDAIVEFGRGLVEMPYDAGVGGYQYTGITPGTYALNARSHDLTVMQTKSVSLAGGAAATLDFVFPSVGSISGKVVDETDDPVAGAAVIVIRGHYRDGALTYDSLPPVQTDSQGKYRVEKGIWPGLAVRVLAMKFDRSAALRTVPDDPKDRKPILRPTFYPHSKTVEAAAPVVVENGEARSGVDIHMSSAPPICMTGSFHLDGSAASITAQLDSLPVKQVLGIRQMKPDDGDKFWFCGLPPGDYSLSVVAGNNPPRTASQAYQEIPLADHDVSGLELTLLPPREVNIESAWEGDPPPNAAGSRMGLGLGSGSSVTLPVGGQVSVPWLAAAPDRAVRVTSLPKGAYAKDITFNGISCLYSQFQLTPGVASTLRVLVASDGGFAKVLVADKDGKPVPDTPVHIFPAGETPPAVLAQTRVTGTSDHDGFFASPTLRPGKYYLLATNSAVDDSPEGLARLWEARRDAVEIEITAGATLPVTVTPQAMR